MCFVCRLRVCALQLTFVQGLDHEADNHARAAFHPDAREAGAAFMEKRKGNFLGVGELPRWLKSRL